MAKKYSKHTKKQNTKNKKHYNKRLPKLAFVIVLILVIFLFIKTKSTKVKLGYENTQIILNNENITNLLRDDVIQKNGNIYLSVRDIKSFIDKTLYIEEETDTIITSSEKKLAAIKKDDENILINGSAKTIKNVLIQEHEEPYLAISKLEDVYDYEYNFINSCNIVTIDSLNKKCIKAYAQKNLKVKEETENSSKIIETVSKGNWVVFISDEDGIAKVRTQNGNLGYVKKSYLDNFVAEREDFTENNEKSEDSKTLQYNITKKDISTFEKRLNIIKIILQETIKNDSMYVKIIYNKEENFDFERFKIEVKPILEECGITVDI